MILVFCGTPRFAVPTLQKLLEAGHSVPLVVTQPDRPRGRGMELAFSAVKESALGLSLSITQPDNIKTNDDFRAQLAAFHPDAIIVVGYGRIIPQWMIDLPRLGNLNLHASLLPKYRGAAPIQWAIANGERTTGVTTMRIDAGLDTGDILLQREIPIAPDDTSETLSPKLATMGADLMLTTLHGLEQETVHPTPQDHTKATLAPMIRKEDGRIDFSASALRIYDRLRAFQPWPGAYTTFMGKTLQVRRARPARQADVEKRASPPVLGPGELATEHDRLIVGCGNNTQLELLEIQVEGKRRMSAREFVNGYQPKSGHLLGQ